MVLFLIGLGLGDVRDVSVRALDVIRRAYKVYLESYTSILMQGTAAMVELYGRPVIEADRTFVEQGCEQMLTEAKEHEVCLLIVGDVFCATTHADIFVRAKQLGITVKTIHNAGIMTGVGCTGLELYRFGYTVTVPFFTDSWKPDSFYDRIAQNMRANMHTLVLLDIKVKEQSIENLMRGRQVFEPPRYMTVNRCLEQLLEVEETRKEGVLSADMMAVGVARVGTDTQHIAAGPLASLVDLDFGPPLHCVIIPSKSLSDMERAMLGLFPPRSYEPQPEVAAPAQAPAAPSQ
ncbi:putative Diphthine methyl ester synthase [Paratrimastix pyriformis]|uniref:diphthine methyl ester synthase n=1 Tax=Paratrimastix pyriformis TaxID=342808 RepID=A0ABQ8UQ52_9EUKA|nr:putative Diphthine methyl ester synthase [Paratrimastix pyriformis]